MRLVLHVGLPKTGTSALQHWCALHSDRLRSQGWCYPDGDYLSADKHQFLVGELRRGEFPQTERMLEQSSDRHLLLSSEGLTNHLGDFSAPSLRRFRDLTRERHTTVVLVTRERQAWLRSFHAQCVANPRNGLNELYAYSGTCAEFALEPRVRKLLDTGRLAEELSRGFGAVKLVRMRYGPGVGDRILRLLRVDAGDWPAMARVNTSLPDWLVELLRRINGLYLPADRHAWWKVALARQARVGNLELGGTRADAVPPRELLEQDLARAHDADWTDCPASLVAQARDALRLALVTAAAEGGDSD
jgi:hypothetical protein